MAKEKEIKAVGKLDEPEVKKSRSGARKKKDPVTGEMVKPLSEKELAALAPKVETVPMVAEEKDLKDIAVPQTIVTEETIAEAVTAREETIEDDITEEEVQDATDKATAKVEEKVEKLTMELKESIQLPELQLSKQASGWKDWLAYQRMSPEDFLKNWPTHKMKHFIEEIVAFNAQKANI